MGEFTKIAWADHTFNPWEGCVKISPGCDACYASARDVRLHHGENWGMNAPRLVHRDAYWMQPLRWNRIALESGVRARVFCGSLMDIMEDRRDLDPARARLYQIIRLTPYLDWLLVTKRPMNFQRLLPAGWLGNMPKNIWAITTVESREFTWRIDELFKIPFRIRGVSYEPALGPVDFRPWIHRGLDWLIIGGESKQPGYNPREFDIAWAADAIAQCEGTRCAPFVKQLGSAPMDGAEMLFNIRHNKGEDPEEWPASFRVRRLPLIQEGVATCS